MIANHFRNSLVIYGLLLLMLAAGFGIFNLLNPRVGFKYFEPTVLPVGTSIKAKRIFVYKDYRRVEQNFGTDNWIYTIREDKSGDYAGIGAVDGKYDGRSIKPSCEVRHTPGHLKYRLCHWIDYGRTNVYEVKFIKEGTIVDAQVPSDLGKRINEKQIDTFVDSFRQKSTIGIPVHRSAGA